MSHAKMPPIAHKLYAAGLIVIVVFVIIAWVFTAISVSAKTITNLPDHRSDMAPQTCTNCHQTNASAPRIPHIEMPSCGYCHR
jgi:hypothetical protein